MQVYFIDNDDYFQHHLVSELETQSSPDDNDERSIFFVRGVIETVKKLRWEPSIVHCSGWISALAPLYLKYMYQDDPSFRSAKIVYALFDDDFAQPLDARLVDKLKMDKFVDDNLKSILDGPIDHKAMSRIAMDYADGIVIASDKVDNTLIEYARATGKPILEYPGDDNIQAYADFYDSLLEAE
jgi:starch synthase